MIKLNRVNKYYNKGQANELHVMDGISLELPGKGMIALFGRSGCGKTTMLNAIGGLDSIGGGEITVFGQNIRTSTDQIRNKYIGYIFQNYCLSAGETVFENVANALRLCGLKDEKEIEKRVLIALENVEMEKFKRRLPDTLSGGQQQRVAIARAIVKDPALILADEPTGNLDEANTIMVMDILKRLSREHTVLLVTHEAELVEHYCDRVIEMADGRIISDRQIEGAEGYAERDKNHIYLGELAKNEIDGDGVHIEYYGEPKEISLKIVSADGKLYLKSDTPSLKILDSSSEIVLKEGVFKKTEKAAEREARTPIPPMPTSGEHGYGKLFSFGSSVVSGFRYNFKNKGRKGRRLLHVCMGMLACVAVILTSIFSVSLGSIVRAYEDTNMNALFLNVYSDDATAVNDSIGKNGIEYARLIPYYNYFPDLISFDMGGFVSASLALNTTYNTTVLDVRYAEDLPVEKGKAEITDRYEIVITSSLADNILQNNKSSYLRGYADIVNMRANIGNFNQIYDYRVVGIVRSSENHVFMESVAAAKQVIENTYSSGTVVAASDDVYHEGDIGRGEIVVINTDMLSTAPDSSFMIAGKKYDVKDHIRIYTNLSSYGLYYEEKYGESLLSPSQYREQIIGDDTVDDVQTEAAWFFDYYVNNLPDFAKVAFQLDIGTWIYCKYGLIRDLVFSYSLPVFPQMPAIGSAVSLYAAYLYENEFGVYPDYAQLSSYREENYYSINAAFEAVKEDAEYYNVEYEKYYKNMVGNSRYVMNDEDYVELAYRTGDNDFGYVNYNYLLVGVSDMAAARAYIEQNFRAQIVTPDDIIDEALSGSAISILANVAGLVVVLALICLCIYFIMRSALMSRVREIGIFRAIGVTRKNMTFRFFIESMVLTTLTTLIGFIFAAVIMGYLASVPALSSVLYFPFWLGLSLLAVLYGVSALFGTLPVRLLLRKTPSEILAKYDI